MKEAGDKAALLLRGRPSTAEIKSLSTASREGTIAWLLDQVREIAVERRTWRYHASDSLADLALANRASENG
jgi:hypothetical protein